MNRENSINTHNPYRLLGWNVDIEHLSSRAMTEEIDRRVYPINQQALNLNNFLNQPQNAQIQLIAQLPAEPNQVEEISALPVMNEEEQQIVQHVDQEVLLDLPDIIEQELLNQPLYAESQLVAQLPAEPNQVEEISALPVINVEEQQIVQHVDQEVFLDLPDIIEQETLNQSQNAETQLVAPLFKRNIETSYLPYVSLRTHRSSAPILVSAPPEQSQMILDNRLTLSHHSSESSSSENSSWSGWEITAVVIWGLALTAGVVATGLCIGGVFSSSSQEPINRKGSLTWNSNPSAEKYSPNNLAEHNLKIEGKNIIKIETGEVVGRIKPKAISYVMTFNNNDKGYWYFDNKNGAWISVGNTPVRDCPNFNPNKFAEQNHHKVGLDKDWGFIVSKDNIKEGCYYKIDGKLYYQYDGQQNRWEYDSFTKTFSPVKGHFKVFFEGIEMRIGAVPSATPITPTKAVIPLKSNSSTFAPINTVRGAITPLKSSPSTAPLALQMQPNQICLVQDFKNTVPTPRLVAVKPTPTSTATQIRTTQSALQSLLQAHNKVKSGLVSIQMPSKWN